MHYFVSILVCNHLEDGERAGCFVIIVYRCIVTINVMWLFLTVPWVGLLCVIVIFFYITHLPFARWQSA